LQKPGGIEQVTWTGEQKAGCKVDARFATDFVSDQS
jgi:hypothetical protein